MVGFPPVIAHRGDRRYAPENTLAAFRQAAAKGARWIECDASLTRDHAAPVVVFHDDTVGRTTNLPDRLLAETGFAELRAADAGTWFADAFAGERVPTLAETLRLCDELKVCLDIEIKVPGTGRDIQPEPFEPETARLVARRVIEDVRAIRGDRWDGLLLSSFSTTALTEAKLLAPLAPRAYLLHQIWPEDAYDDSLPVFCRLLAATEPAAVGFNHELLSSRERLVCFRRAIARTVGWDLPVLSYTVNDRLRAETLWEWGVASIFTDAPGDLSGDGESTGASHD